MTSEITEEEVRKIAGGLTKASRDVLVRLDRVSPCNWYDLVEPFPRVGHRTIDALIRRQLAQCQAIIRDAEGRRINTAIREITPLGRAVASYLKAQEQKP